MRLKFLQIINTNFGQFLKIQLFEGTGDLLKVDRNQGGKESFTIKIRIMHQERFLFVGLFMAKQLELKGKDKGLIEKSLD